MQVLSNPRARNSWRQALCHCQEHGLAGLSATTVGTSILRLESRGYVNLMPILITSSVPQLPRGLNSSQYCGPTLLVNSCGVMCLKVPPTDVCNCLGLSAYIYMCTHTYIISYMYIHACTYVPTERDIYVYICISIYVCIHVCIYVYIYIFQFQSWICSASGHVPLRLRPLGAA